MPNIVILATGGTIAGTAGSSESTVRYAPAVVGIDALIKALPELEGIANVTCEQVAQIASEDINDEIWLMLAKRANELVAAPWVDGLVITSGTDTMEETAYFLNLVVKSGKPVVLTGAMRPLTAISADGKLNLYNSVVLAGSESARGMGVLVAMNETIYSARDVIKSSTFLSDAFRSPELGALGYIQSKEALFYKQPLRRHTAESRFDITGLNELPRVDIAYGYANASRVIIDALTDSGVHGIVYAGVGNGSITAEVREGLISARKKGVIVVRSTRVGNGIVARNAAADDDGLDFVAADTLNPQKSRVLLMLALTQTNDTTEIQQIFFDY